MDVVISVNDGQANLWASQYVKRQPSQRSNVNVPQHCTVSQATLLFKDAIRRAGHDGLLIFNVGHGGASSTGNTLDGTVEIAPNGTMTLGGANIANTFVNVFYDVNFGGAGAFSQQENDARFNAGTPGARSRAANWAVYKDLADAIRSARIRKVIFLTCRVGNAPDFLKKIANDWYVVIEAYLVQVALQQQQNGNVRMFLFTDPPGTGTNIPIGEDEVPLATGGNSVRVGPPL
jgi:hypothetical protein